MNAEERVDAIVIGSGQGGVPFAVAMAKRGKSVVLFERGPLGGTCVNNGCTPSKALLGAAHAAGRARRAQALGIHATLEVDAPFVFARTRKIRDEFRSGVERRLTKAGVRVVRAEARFVGRRRVSGGGTLVEAPLVLIDSGNLAVVPSIPGLAGTPYLTNADVFDLERLPRRLLALGGGYIGLELGQGFARLGSRVRIIDRNPRVLVREEADVAETLQRSLAADGVELSLNAEVVRVDYDGGEFSLTLKDGAVFRGDALLVAIGRKTKASSLDLPAGGVELDAQGNIRIDERLRTTCEGVYAIGDAAGQPPFTHVSWEDYRRLVAILDGEGRTRGDRVLAYAVFTEPQVGRVGLTLEDARRRGLRARAATLPYAQIARGIEWGLEEGFARIVIDEESERIIGATMVGYEAAELIHVFLAHMEAGSTWRVLDRSVHVHPTLAEGLPSLARLLA
ncbi:MAG: FAD-dependent oxidoreductase [bacterium]|nr:FAD-dependent oxidoreductase [bacterium]